MRGASVISPVSPVIRGLRFAAFLLDAVAYFTFLFTHRVRIGPCHAERD
jgi:hypothetical protein